jgi:2-haloacid dehalogenase
VRPTAIVFDLYGTLLHIHALRERVRAAGINDADAFVEAWRNKQIEFSWCCTLMGEYRDFDSLTKKALAYVLASFRHELKPAAAEALAAGWLELQPHDDVQPYLEELRKRKIPLAVLTNGVKASAERALRAAGIRDAFDALLSVESVRVYKPHANVYKLATTHFKCDPERLMFVSSNGWDASGASAFGFRVVYCNRAGKPAETLGYPPFATIGALAEISSLLD